MTLVDDCREIEENLKALELVRSSGKGVEFENYRSLVAKGHFFLPYLTAEGIAFAPSRFLGCKGNTVRKHAQREHKDGRETTPRIRQVLAKKFGFTTWNFADSEAEAYFVKFCSSLGVEPNKVRRTYWITPEIGDWLSDYPPESCDAKTEARRDEELEQEVRNDGSLPETTRASIIRAQVGQGLFRRLVLRKYGSCLITALTEHKLLIASHIKPWRDCCHNPAECLSPDNALLLSPTWDALFDKGFASFSDDGKLLLSERLSKSSRQALRVEDVQIHLTSRQVSYMRHHRALHGFEA